jgi:hypothetical protein
MYDRKDRLILNYSIQCLFTNFFAIKCANVLIQGFKTKEYYNNSIELIKIDKIISLTLKARFHGHVGWGLEARLEALAHALYFHRLLQDEPFCLFSYKLMPKKNCGGIKS